MESIVLTAEGGWFTLECEEDKRIGDFPEHDLTMRFLIPAEGTRVPGDHRGVDLLRKACGEQNA